MKKQSIAQLKELFQRETIRAEDLNILRTDERKGVQALLKTYDKRQEQLAKERLAFQKMQQFDQSYKQVATDLLAGIDEAGRGPLAGPVVSAAVILPEQFECIGLTDSKLLSIEQRNEFYHYITEHALSYYIAIVDHKEIDRLNILEATKKSMLEAIENLSLTPDITLIDAVTIQRSKTKTIAITKGDQKSLSIAAASVLAKVARDRIMDELDEQYPQYEFKRNKGYGSANHLAALEKYGPSPYHRLSFSPVQKSLK
ncbi:MAG TPA: ribonuclease HII [Pseudogracilibacillus sp.]|nr:ribonuclease HII [Pseudogracilibacillus sp.]